MFIVVRLDTYDDGDCGCFNKGTIDDAYGPFPDRAAADKFKNSCEEQNLFASEFQVRELRNPEVPTI